MSVNFSEYNQIHLPRAEHLYSFMRNLEHAMQKTEDFEGAMHQLKCIGYSEKFIEEMATIAHDYKAYHKQRIEAEQTADLPTKKYPFIAADRLDQYVENRKLIQMIHDHDDFQGDLRERIETAITEELDVNVYHFLAAYLSGDVDRMVQSLTGWNLEALLAKAKVIPDAKEYFYQPGDFPVSEITFPLYGKETITVEEFKEYILSNYEIHDDTWKLIRSAIRFATTAKTQEAKQNCLWALLKDSIGIPEEVVRMVQL